MTSPKHTWQKSSYSGGEGQCIEWAPAHAITTGTVPVRDSKNPHGPTLAFGTTAWTAFVAGVKTSEFIA
ncbi:DUF397 domain-containing protein [Streptomyces sp. HSW2009]|uniref:DUF397 domain-containing protein n=1 Tax=Streptomyces sp. HSW2009 TaxID=3142890 RepID=UPI0032F0129D